MKKTILPLFIFLFAFYVSNANHAAGGELTYSLVPGQTNQYQFILKFYKDCANGAAPNILSLCYANDCGVTNQSANMQLYAPQGGVLPNGRIQGDAVPIGCVGGNSTCNGGVIPGYQEWWYTCTLTLPTQCNSWKFWTYLCCRNTILVNVAPTGQNFFVEATLDNTNNQNLNSSPYFSNYPIPYVCLNTPFSYDYGVIDPDGDLLVYSVVEPRSNMGCGNYVPTNLLAPNFNIVNNPFPTNNTFNINSSTGVFSFLPTVSGPYAFTIKVSEYRNGNLIGYVLRDVQFYVNTCQLPPSNITQEVDQNITGGKYIGGEVISCVGDSLHFCYNINSANPLSELMLTDNAANILTGATVAYQNMHTDSVTTCVSWLPTIADTGIHTITIYTVDSACMLAGQLVIDTEIVVVHVKNYITPVISVSANINQGATNDPIIYTAVTNCTVIFNIFWYRNNSLAYTSNNTVWNDIIVPGNNNVYAIIKDPDMCLLPDSAISGSITIQNIPNNVNNIAPENFKLYPNPSSGKLIFEGLEYGDNIKIYNLQGMLLYNETVSSKTKNINVQTYSKGFYNVAVQRKDRHWTMKFEKL